jgi:predicted ATPase
VSLGNFKAFDVLKDTPLSDISVLCGTNSSGKSSILHALLLLKQSLESEGQDQSILLNGPYVRLGRFSNIVYGQRNGSAVRLKVNMANINPKGRSSVLPIYIFLNENLKKGLDSDRYDMEIEWELKIDDRFSVERYLSPINLVRFFAKINQANSKKEATLIIERDELGDFFNVKAHGFMNPFAAFPVDNENDDGSVFKEVPEERGEKDFLINNISVSFFNMQPRPSMKKNSDSASDGGAVSFASYLTDSIFDVIKAEMRDVSYVGPLREEPARRYIYEEEVVQIGKKGENAAYIFNVHQSDIINDVYFFVDGHSSFDRMQNIALGDAMVKWTDYMGIPRINPSTEYDVIKLNVDAGIDGCSGVNIADVGFGISQVFPILLEGLRVPIGGVAIFEQPEIHLHPAMQMKLADFFVSMAMSGRRVIIETHSEHIINRFTRRAIEDSVYGLSDKISIYFVRKNNSLHGEGASVIVEKVRIDPMRGISNWPIDFFGQSADEIEKIIKAGIRKRAGLK